MLAQEHHVKFEKYKMQDALIQEEEEGQRIDTAKAAAKAAADREKKQRKKVSCVHAWRSQMQTWAESERLEQRDE